MKENCLLPGVFAVGLGLWIEKDNALVIADLHLGIEEMFNKQGNLLPRFNFREIKKHLLERVFAKARPELIIINGDLKHEFGMVSEQEWSEVIDMLRFLQSKCSKLVLIRGNHDKILGPIADWENLELEEEGILLGKSSIFVTHGHQIPKSKAFFINDKSKLKETYFRIIEMDTNAVTATPIKLAYNAPTAPIFK